MHGAGNPPSRADGVYQVVEIISMKWYYAERIILMSP